jgi:hypothetical protein
MIRTTFAACILFASSLGALIPSAVAITRDQSTICVCNQTNGTVNIINPKQKTRAVVAVGLEPVAIALTPDDTKACVCNSRSDTVSVVTIATQAVETIDVPGAPRYIAITPNGLQAYVSCDDNKITILDLVKFTVLSSIPFEAPGVITITPDGRKACVAVPKALCVIDTITKALTTIPVPATNPFLAIASVPDSKKVCLLSDPTLWVIHLDTHAVQSSFVGPNASNVTVSPSGAKIYITRNFSGSAENGGMGMLEERDLWYEGLEGSSNEDESKTDVREHEVSPVTDEGRPVRDDGCSNGGGSALPVTQKGPSRPPKFTGKIKRFSHKKRSLCLRWAKTSSKDVVRYEIFAYKKKIATIPATRACGLNRQLHRPFTFGKGITKSFFRRLHNKYKIRAVSATGAASRFRYLDIVHHKIYRARCVEKTS